MGAVFRLTDDIEKWLKTIDENPHKAIKIVLEGYTAHEDLKKEHRKIICILCDDINSKLEEIDKNINGLKQVY